MAKVEMPLWSGIGKGKLGDIVFMRRLGKNVVRIKVKPANPRTEKQTLIRDNITGLTRAWKYAGETGDVTLHKIDRTSTPWTVTDVTFAFLTTDEKATWKYIWDFVGENMRRLLNNMDPVRENPGALEGGPA